ncbi:MAG: three-Cys-motif partner protein TcmP [Nitrospina sp.]|nr:three-Cys-motif partner protein TcmP [Nitrospina sp.]
MGKYNLNGGIGCSRDTILKQNNLRTILKTHFAICKSIMATKYYANKTYQWFDLTAGDGLNPEDGTSGSALIFYEEAILANIIFNAVFIDKSEQNCKLLTERLPERKDITIICGDHKDIMPKFMSNRKQFNLGFVYMDGNGIPNFNILSKISESNWFKNIDLLINCPATAIKRSRSNKPYLSENIKSINKKDWVIRTPAGPWQWSLLIGSNWHNFPAWKKHDFYKITSDTGQMVFNVLNKSKRERDGCQMNMFHTELIRSI